MEWDEGRDWDAQEGALCSLVGKFKGDTAPRDLKLLVVVLRNRAALEGILSTICHVILT
jgi:hypothetical protein